MITFINDEKEYLFWLERHPKGFVVNSYKKPLSSFLMLHCADCGTINSKKGNHTTHDYIKICSRDRKELENWSQNIIGGTLSEHCKP